MNESTGKPSHDMSSWVRKGTEDNPPSNAGGLSRYEENMTTPTTTSTETTTVAMEGNTQTSNNVAPVKSTDMSSRRVQWYHRKQPLVPSTSSDHVGLDSVFNFGKTQAKPQGIAADETETSVQQDTSSCATESKGAAAADLTSKPDHGGLAPSTSDEMRTAAMSTPTGQRGSNEHAPSEVADIYKALETLTHSQTNQTTRQESIKPFPTFVVGAEASFSNSLKWFPAHVGELGTNNNNSHDNNDSNNVNGRRHTETPPTSAPTSSRGSLPAATRSPRGQPPLLCRTPAEE
ncbi:probable myosin light chain kinase DDB_G0279831 [Dermacentor silvarum]|uniref:probable myosin light chain kinase DDB_G0279831 n=1 Tax=Dermacentor silvarum TaxID=543639 RepID=UPI002101085B|nr:probable myosin light chain kinase DDB_G0279831 [Dermacentor silvarum]